MTTELLTINLAAERCRVSRKTIERAIQAGELIASDLGEPGARRPTTRIKPDELEAWVDRRSRGERRTSDRPPATVRRPARPRQATRGRLQVMDGMGRAS